jgi:hypothetical protein
MALALGVPTASAQPKPAPSASASAAAKDAKGDKKDAKDDKKDAKGASSAAPSDSALPAGHPPVEGEGLPAGHPRVDDQEGGDEAPGDERFFRAPQDTSSDDATLPPGSIVVTIKDAQNKPIPRAPVALAVLHSSAAKGDSNERFSAVADENGVARFDGQKTGQGHIYRVITTRGAASYGTPQFILSLTAGKRAVLHSYEVSASSNVFMKGDVYVGLREDAIVVEQVIGVLNISPTAWLAEVPVELPRGFKAFNARDGQDDARIEEDPDKGAVIRGTFPPGQRELSFRYQIPFNHDQSQSLSIRLPQRSVQVRVIAEAAKSMTLAVAGFPPSSRTEGRDGKRYLVTEKTIQQQGDSVSMIDLTLGGLPTRGPGRWIAVALAALAFVAGLAYVLQGESDGTVDEDTERDLAEAREALLDEIVSLEKAYRAGEIGPKTYSRVRASLLDALAKIVSMIEETQPKKPKKPEPKRTPRRMEPST